MSQQKKHKKRRRSRPRKNSKRSGGGILFIIGFLVVFIVFSLWLLDREHGKESREIVNFSRDSLTYPVCNPRQPGQIIEHTGYNVSYNTAWRLPNWVAYEHTRDKASAKAAKRKDNFAPDPEVTGRTASSGDYKGSGFDRGHMAPAADMKWSETAMNESFYFSNICPQHPQLNRQGWKKLEDKVRQWAVSDSAIIVVCGPLVSDGRKLPGKNSVAIPRGFFKVILSPFAAKPQAIGFVFGNEQAAGPLRNYIVSVDSVETLTGIDFFSSLPDEIESAVEAAVDTLYWGL